MRTQIICVEQRLTEMIQKLHRQVENMVRAGRRNDEDELAFSFRGTERPPSFCRSPVALSIRKLLIIYTSELSTLPACNVHMPVRWETSWSKCLRIVHLISDHALWASFGTKAEPEWQNFGSVVVEIVWFQITPIWLQQLRFCTAFTFVSC